MKITTKQNSDFISYIMSNDALQGAIEYIADYFSPEEVFTRNRLEEWALENGFKKNDNG